MPVKLLSARLICDECGFEYIIVGTIRNNVICPICREILMIVDEED